MKSSTIDTKISLDDLPTGPFETERLVLRPYEEADIALVHENLDSDEEVWRYDPGHERSVAERAEIISTYAALHRQFGFGPCGAWTREGQFVGQGGLSPHLFEHADGSRNVEFEVMYKIARPAWRQGYAREIARFWTDFAFSTIGLSRLVTCVDRENEASVAVQRSLGATIVDDWLDESGLVATILHPASR